MLSFHIADYPHGILFCKTKNPPKNKLNKTHSIRPSSTLFINYTLCVSFWAITFDSARLSSCFWCLLLYHIPDLMERGICMWKWHVCRCGLAPLWGLSMEEWRQGEQPLRVLTWNGTNIEHNWRNDWCSVLKILTHLIRLKVKRKCLSSSHDSTSI